MLTVTGVGSGWDQGGVWVVWGSGWDQGVFSGDLRPWTDFAIDAAAATDQQPDVRLPYLCKDMYCIHAIRQIIIMLLLLAQP